MLRDRRMAVLGKLRRSTRSTGESQIWADRYIEERQR